MDHGHSDPFRKIMDKLVKENAQFELFDDKCCLCFDDGETIFLEPNEYRFFKEDEVRVFSSIEDLDRHLTQEGWQYDKRDWDVS